MGPKEEPGILVLLLGLAITLYAVTWLLAGPPGDRDIPADDVPIPAIKVALAAHQLDPEPLLRSH
jgi:hypothetical protein